LSAHLAVNQLIFSNPKLVFPRKIEKEAAYLQLLTQIKTDIKKRLPDLQVFLSTQQHAQNSSSFLRQLILSVLASYQRVFPEVVLPFELKSI